MSTTVDGYNIYMQHSRRDVGALLVFAGAGGVAIATTLLGASLGALIASVIALVSWELAMLIGLPRSRDIEDIRVPLILMATWHPSDYWKLAPIMDKSYPRYRVVGVLLLVAIISTLYYAIWLVVVLFDLLG
jgi:hypothetical protein